MRNRKSALVFLLIPVAGAGRLAYAQTYTSGNVVVAVEGCGVQGGTCTAVTNGTGTGTLNSSSGGYGDNQAAPLTLFQFKPTGTSSVTYVNSVVLPQTTVGANLPVSGEYGSSSEGTLQLSGTGQYLTLAAYGINAATFDASPATYGASPSLALAQSGSLTGQSYTAVPRVVALIDPYGNVNSSSALYNIYNTNNPRSVFSANGTSVCLSGQGTGTDATGGVFFSSLYATNNSPTAITGLDSTSTTTSQDARDVQIVNGTLYISVDSKQGSGSTRSFVGTLGTPPATSLYASGAGPTELALANNATTPVAVTANGKLVLTASETNGLNATGQTINISPSAYFFANAYTMYVADTGNGKQTSASTTLGDGGLQKWINTKTDGTGTWELMYTVSSGLGLVANPTNTAANTSGTTGLYALTGVVSGTTVSLYATNATISDLDTTYLYGFTDTLAATTNPGTSFTLLATAPKDSNFKGVAMAPTLPAGSATVLSVPSGLAVSTSGTGCVPGSYITPFTLVWTPGSTCQLSTTSPQTSGGLSYTFSNWQDGTTSTTDTVTAPTTSATYTATFANANAPAQLAFTSAPATSVTAGGTAGSVQVSVETTAGSVASTSAASVTLTVTGPGSYSQTYTSTAASGVASFNLASAPVLTAAGTYTYTATSTGLTSATSTETVSAGSFAILAVSGLASETQPGVAQSVTVTAEDQYRNTATGFTGSVRLTSSDPEATLPAAYTYTSSDAGVHLFSVTLGTAGSYTVSATSGSVVGTSSAVTIQDAVWLLNAADSLQRTTDAGVQTLSVGSTSGTSTRGGVAFDNAGDVWATQMDRNGFVEYSATGTLLLSGSATGGLSTPTALAIDGAGKVWLANAGNGSVTALSTAGTALSPSTGYQAGALSTPTGVVIDSSGSVWISNSGNNTVTKILGAAAPAVTPIVTGTVGNTLGTEP